MAALASLGNLKDIHFFAPFTGETLAGITGFRSLTYVDLDSSPVTDAGWPALASAMPELNKITFLRPPDSTGPVSVAAMGEHLGRLKNLTDFRGGHAGITDEWMPGIARLKNLKSLSLQGAGLTDTGLATIKDLPIDHLIIRQTGLTDTAIPILKEFPNLRTMEYAEGMSKEGVAEVKDFLDSRKK
jgi:hypothetical protein